MEIVLLHSPEVILLIPSPRLGNVFRIRQDQPPQDDIVLRLVVHSYIAFRTPPTSSGYPEDGLALSRE